MTTELDIKKLWGRAAGHCSYPGCAIDCVTLLDNGSSVLIGEMAHVIAKQPAGPRGGSTKGDDSYDNLILLCPTHHTLIDKGGESNFPAKQILQWKAEHETRVRDAFKTEVYSTKAELGKAISCLLDENFKVWSSYGPESAIAKTNPVSSAAFVWQLRKLSTIVPNNNRVGTLIHRHIHLFDGNERTICASFIEHARMFEMNCYDRQDSDIVPRFPQEFTVLVRRL